MPNEIAVALGGLLAFLLFTHYLHPNFIVKYERTLTIAQEAA